MRAELAGTTLVDKKTAKRKGSVMGIEFFENAASAIAAGYEILSQIPDSEGFLHARLRTARGFAIALVRANNP